MVHGVEEDPRLLARVEALVVLSRLAVVDVEGRLDGGELSEELDAALAVARDVAEADEPAPWPRPRRLALHQRSHLVRGQQPGCETKRAWRMAGREDRGDGLLRASKVS